MYRFNRNLGKINYKRSIAKRIMRKFKANINYVFIV